MLTEIDVHRVQPVDSLPGVVRPYGLVVPDVRDSEPVKTDKARP